MLPRYSGRPPGRRLTLAGQVAPLVLGLALGWILRTLLSSAHAVPSSVETVGTANSDHAVLEGQAGSLASARSRRTPLLAFVGVQASATAFPTTTAARTGGACLSRAPCCELNSQDCILQTGFTASQADRKYNYEARRAALRASWVPGSPAALAALEREQAIRVRFVIGHSADPAAEAACKAEEAAHGDFLRLNLTEAYNSLPTKTLLFLRVGAQVGGSLQSAGAQPLSLPSACRPLPR